MILAILQARYSSSRLPGKVLEPILGKPMLTRQLERVERSRIIDQVVIATSTDPSDDVIAVLCSEMHIECFRGSLNDVLDRFYMTAQKYPADHIVRLTGDCPLIDAGIIDGVIEMHLNGNYDYTSNGLKRTFPDGLDVEVFKHQVLKETWEEAFLPSHREHVTPFIYNNPVRYKLGNYLNEEDNSELRWTVDEEPDLILIKKIYEKLYLSKPEFSMSDILNLLETNPEFKRINDMYKCNEGLEKSLIEDQLFMDCNVGKNDGGR